MSTTTGRSQSTALLPGLAPILTLHITNVTCTSHLITPSELYRLSISAEPVVLMGLHSTQSRYIRAQSAAQTWEDPFGGRFSITLSIPDHRIKITLVQRRSRHSGGVVGSCVLDTSSLERAAHGLPLISLKAEEIGRIVLSITSTVSSMSTVQPDAARHLDALSTADVAEPIKPYIQRAAATPIGPALTGTPDPWKLLRDRLDSMLSLGDPIAQIHPYISLAWGVVSVAYKTVSAQGALDEKTKGLLNAMGESCSFADDTAERNDHLELSHVIIRQILEQVIECAYFIRDYCQDTASTTRLIEKLGDTVDGRINRYKANLVVLQQALLSGTTHLPSAIWSRAHVLDLVIDQSDFSLLKDMEYAREAHPNLNAGCLPGTRTEIMDAIFYWGLGADAPPPTVSNTMMLPYRQSSRILWVCGALGTGKTSIIRSSAARMERIGCRRVYYGFDKNQPRASIARLFSTIARDLADLDPTGKRRLVELLKQKTEIRTTGDCELQFQHFIVDTAVGTTSFGETVIFIDAFDESGKIDSEERRQLLYILTQRASEVPAGLRVVITSRDERDVLDALESPSPGIDVIRMQDIAEALTFRDIDKYVKASLLEVKELQVEKYRASLDQLVGKAGTSFQWAATACRFIKSDGRGGVIRSKQLEKVLKSNQGLDALYTTIMEQYFDCTDEESLALLKSLLGRILCAREPLPLRALTQLLPPTSVYSVSLDDFLAQQRDVRFLGSLLSGTQDDTTPIVLLHASYREFLHDPERSGAFFVDEKEAHELMAFACFRVMESELEFNIGRIPTSFLRNLKTPNIEGLIRQHVSLQLSYASRNWSFHASEMSNIALVADSLVWLLREGFLKWLEVMSLTQTDPHGVLTAIPSVKISAELAGVKDEVLQFVSMFRQVISESVPHIYLSAMAFMPTCSELYNSQHARYPGIVRMLQGKLNNWPTLHSILKGHTDRVTSVAFSADGLCLASGSYDNTVRIWNAKTGTSVGPPLEGHTSMVNSIAFSPDGLCLASGSDDTTIRIWDAKTGASIGKPLKGHADSVTSIAFSPDGLHLASGSSDSTIQIWDAKTGVRIGAPLKGHTRSVNSISFSPDGRSLASGSWDKTIRIWDTRTGASSGAPLEGHTRSVTSITFSPDGLRLGSTSHDMTVQIWDAKTGASIGAPLEGHTNSVNSAAFSPNSLRLASGSWDNTVRIWDATTGAGICAPLEGHTDSVTSVAFSPNGLSLVSASYDRTVQIWDAQMGASISAPLEGHSMSVASITFSPDGLRLASGSWDETVRIWDVTTGASIGVPLEGHTSSVTSIAFSPDGLCIASASRDRTIQMWEARTGARIGAPLEGHTDSVNSIAFSPDGLRLASGSDDETVRIWDVMTGASIGTPLEGHTHSVNTIAFSSDGLHLASGSRDRTVQIWDAKTGARIGAPLEGHTNSVDLIAFSSDNLRLASASLDGTVQSWDAKTGASIVVPLEGYTNLMTSIAFSPDGLHFASASHDGTVRIWDMKTGARIGLALEGHTDSVTSVAFSPDGLHLASGSRDKTVRIWNVKTGASIDALLEGPTSRDQVARTWVGEKRVTSREKHSYAVPSHTTSPDRDSVSDSSYQRVLRRSQLPDQQNIQYPHHLFPPSLQHFQLQDGWILGPNGELITWVPAAYQPSLIHPDYIVCGLLRPVELDFRYLKCGEEWTQCRNPISKV